MTHNVYDVIQKAQHDRATAIGELIATGYLFLIEKISATWTKIMHHPVQLNDSYFVGAKSIYDVEAILREFGRSGSLYRK